MTSNTQVQENTNHFLKEHTNFKFKDNNYFLNHIYSIDDLKSLKEVLEEVNIIVDVDGSVDNEKDLNTIIDNSKNLSFSHDNHIIIIDKSVSSNEVNIYPFKQLFDIKTGMSGIDENLINKTTLLFREINETNINNLYEIDLKKANDKIVIEKYGDKYRLVKPHGTTFDKLAFLKPREDLFYYNRIFEDELFEHIQQISNLESNTKDLYAKNKIIREIVKKTIYSEVYNNIDDIRKKSFAENLSNLIQENILYNIVQKQDSDQIWIEMQSSLAYNTKNTIDDIKNIMKSNVNKDRLNKLKFLKDALTAFAEKISEQLSFILIPERKSFVLLLLEKYNLLHNILLEKELQK